MGHQPSETSSCSWCQVYRIVYDHSVFVFSAMSRFTSPGSLTLTYTHTPSSHTHSEFRDWAISIPKANRCLLCQFQPLFWRCWPGEKIKSFIQNPLLANGRASCLVPAPLWFVFDRSVSNQITIGQPIEKRKKVETKKFMPVVENLSRHVGNMSMTSWQPTVFLKWRANKLRIFIMQALSSNSARSLTNTAASKN